MKNRLEQNKGFNARAKKIGLKSDEGITVAIKAGEEDSYIIQLTKGDKIFTKTLKSNEINDEAISALVAEAKKEYEVAVASEEEKPEPANNVVIGAPVKPEDESEVAAQKENAKKMADVKTKIEELLKSDELSKLRKKHGHSLVVEFRDQIFCLSSVFSLSFCSDEYPYILKVMEVYEGHDKELWRKILEIIEAPHEIEKIPQNDCQDSDSLEDNATERIKELVKRAKGL